MPQRPSSPQRLHVLVTVPSGASGQGGIDRIMGALKRQLERRNGSDVAAQFLVSRGSGPTALSVFAMASFCLRMIVARMAGRADVVHINLSSHGSTYRKLVIAACARMLGMAYVLHLHGSQYQSFWKESGFLSRRIRSLFEHAARVIVLGRMWRDFVMTRAPGAADKIIIVPNATETPSLPRRGGKHVHILFLGRLGERKGVPHLIDALGRLSASAGWHATIAGDGDIEAVRAKAAALGLGERVSLPGWVGPDEVTSLFASADILALPSFAENLPVSVIEGMAAGLAVVATPVGAVEDIIVHEQSGLLVPPGDVHALTEALRRLIEDPALRARLGAAALTIHRERLDLTPFAEAICDVWKQAARWQ